MDAPLQSAVESLLSILDTEGARLHALLTRITLRADVAEDLLQDLFVKLSHSDQFAAARSPLAYARQAAIHLAFDWRRKRNRRPELEMLGVDAPCESISPLIEMIAREEFESLLQAMDRLPAMQRDCLVMRHLQHQSYDEIGLQFQKNAHQIRAICHKGVSSLRKQFESVQIERP